MSDIQDRVATAVERRRAEVNAAIPDELPVAEPKRLYEASRYLLDAGGKRLRPAMLLLSAEALEDVDPLSVDYRAFPDGEGGTADIMAAAVSIEVIHLFTLIHDDIMDDDPLRRGVPAVHEAYDMDTAILAGDTLYSKAFEIMLDTGVDSDREVRALDRLATTCTEICEGQALDIQFETRDDVTAEEYHGMIERKTAVLYGAAASVPAILLGHDDETKEAMHHYGLEAGRAFQIQDDVLDLTTSSEKLGKERGSDLIEGKQTLITAHARANGVDVKGLLDDQDGANDEQIAGAVATLEDAGSIEYARETAKELVTRAKARLDVLPDNEARARLEDIADFLIEREY